MQLPRFLVLFALLACAFPANAQIKLKTYTTATDTFYWKRYISIPPPSRLNLKHISIPNAGKVVDAFLAKHLDQFPQFTTDSLPKFTVKTLKKCLFPVDINGDDLPDMIFSGFSGGESDIVRIYLNRRDSFELVFEDYQYLTKFRKEAGKLVELQTGDEGCCGNYLWFTRDYRVEHGSGGPVFIRVRQHVVYQHTEEPANYYPRGIPFVSKADTMMLRASAALLNEPFDPDLDTFGNIIARYRTKARGVVLAGKSYGKGNEWYFVEISPGTYPSASILYDLSKMPSFVCGWVSGQSVLLDTK